MPRIIWYLVVFSVLAAPSAASTIYSTSFENPPFHTGQAAGQDGWVDFGNPANVFIEDTFADTGSQALQISATGAAGQAGVLHPESFDTSTSADKTVLVTVDMLRQSGGILSAVQDLAGFDGSGTDLGVIRWANNDSLLIVSGGGTIIIPNALTLDTWNLFGLEFDFTTRTFSAFLNGTLEASDLPFAGSSSSPVWGGASLTIQGPVSDNVFFDNYNSSTLAAVPEPGTASLGILVVLGFVAMRRRLRAAAR
jgi:hypothetical protein